MKSQRLSLNEIKIMYKLFIRKITHTSPILFNGRCNWHDQLVLAPHTLVKLSGLQNKTDKTGK